MDVDPMEAVEAVEAAGDEPTRRRLNAAVAITVAFLATFMAICQVKGDNIVQAMQQAQADKLDHWAFYQARNLRQEVAEATLVQLRLARLGKAGAEAGAYDEAIARAATLSADQGKKKEALKLQAEAAQQHYDALNVHDDQFDLSEALLAIALALLAITALTGLWWLYWVSLVPIGFGVLMGLAGLLSWGLHPVGLARLLS